MEKNPRAQKLQTENRIKATLSLVVILIIAYAIGGALSQLILPNSIQEGINTQPLNLLLVFTTLTALIIFLKPKTKGTQANLRTSALLFLILFTFLFLIGSTNLYHGEQVIKKIKEGANFQTVDIYILEPSTGKTLKRVRTTQINPNTGKITSEHVGCIPSTILEKLKETKNPEIVTTN